jgi:hypothetical protein
MLIGLLRSSSVTCQNRVQKSDASSRVCVCASYDCVMAYSMCVVIVIFVETRRDGVGRWNGGCGDGTLALYSRSPSAKTCEQAGQGPRAPSHTARRSDTLHHPVIDSAILTDSEGERGAPREKRMHGQMRHRQTNGEAAQPRKHTTAPRPVEDSQSAPRGA